MDFIRKTTEVKYCFHTSYQGHVLSARLIPVDVDLDHLTECTLCLNTFVWKGLDVMFVSTMEYPILPNKRSAKLIYVREYDHLIAILITSFVYLADGIVSIVSNPFIPFLK